MGIFNKFKEGFQKSASAFSSGLKEIIIKKEIDDENLDKIEEFLIQSDVGVEVAASLKKKISETKIDPKKETSAEILKIFSDHIVKTLKPLEKNMENLKENSPCVILIAGVNGVGKTTTIGKLAHKYKSLGKKVMLGAADTFRAGAIDQLQVWADRVGVKLVKQSMGSDPASVAFDTLKSAKAQGIDVVIIDTAGRLHNKVNLMNELTKIKRVMDKIISDSPHEVLLVLDGSTGQNAFEQAREFSSATNVSSLAITKLDGTAKGGVVLGISHQFKIPVKYIGVGEKIEDLQFFDPKSFVDSFFK